MLLVCALSVTGQEDRTVTVEDLPGMVYRGTKEIKRPYRFTTKGGGLGFRLEVDGKGSIRTSSFNRKTGEVDSECIVIGDQIYERSGTGAWTVQTRQEYISAREKKVAAMKDAAAKSDDATYKKLLTAAPRNTATFHAMNPSTPAVIVEPTNANISNKTIEFIGEESRTGNVLRLYRFQGTTDMAKPGNDLREFRLEIVYGFEKVSGALLFARSQDSWVYESKINTFASTYEWEQDPSIVIIAPAVGSSK